MMGLQRYGLVLAGIMIFALVLVAPVSAATVTIDNTTGGGIPAAITLAGSDGTVIMNPGIYFHEYDISPSYNITIQANTTFAGDRTNTIIDAMQDGGIFTNSHSLTIDSLTLRNGTADYGGAINNTGILTISSSTITNCSAFRGGAIYNTGGTVSVTSSTISDCSATDYGGVIFNADRGTVTITSSTISGCSAQAGGAIFNYVGYVTIISSTISGCSAQTGGAFYQDIGNITITSSTITHCTATSGGGGAFYIFAGYVTIISSTISDCTATVPGGAIYNMGGIFTIHFSRIYQNTAPVIYNLYYCYAENNWWGTNDGPAGLTSGRDVSADPWLVLGITANPSSITTAQTSAIRTNLTYNMTGTGVSYDTSALGHLPDGITNLFALDSGSGSVQPLSDGTVSGVAGTTFTPASGGMTFINGTVDDQSVYLTLMVSQAAPTVNGITPSTGLNTSAISITNLSGTNFMSTGTTTVNLTRTGYPNITATGVTVVDTTNITCTFPITHQPAGLWNIVVTNPDEQEGILSDGFMITAPVPTTPPTTVPTTIPTPIRTPDRINGGDDAPVTTTVAVTRTQAPPGTLEVNVGGNSAVNRVVVTGTGITGLIVTGTVQPGPGTNLSAPAGTVFQYISLIPARFDTITGAVIHFSVPQSWLDENHIAPGSIVLYHQTGNGWTALPTTMLSTKDGMVFFSAPTGSFSLFAIAGTPGSAVPVTVSVPPAVLSSAVQEQTPVPAVTLQTPVTTQTTAPPATTAKPSAPSPLLNIVLVIAAIGVLSGGGFLARRWWIRRQNPALFREYDD